MSEDQIKVLKIVQNMLMDTFYPCSRDCTKCKAYVEALDDCIPDRITHEIAKLIAKEDNE